MQPAYKKDLIALAALIVLAVPVISIYLVSHKQIVAPVARWTPFPSVPAEIVLGDTSKRQVIFTFDGGSTAQSGEAILATLRRHHVRGTFFLTGKFVENNPALVREMVADGDEIFNHTYDHPYLTQTSDRRIIWELDALDKALGTALAGSAIAYTTRPYFRAPYGDRDPRVLAAAARDGYRSVYWTVDAGDWEESTGMTAGETANKILSNISPGTIYLMHIGDTITGSMLDGIFTEIEARGYKIVSLTQGL